MEAPNREAIDAAGFEVLPKRWIVERTFAWISRNRRLARDFERYAITVAAFIRLAMIRIMLRRLAANASSCNSNFSDGLLGKRHSFAYLFEVRDPPAKCDKFFPEARRR